MYRLQVEIVERIALPIAQLEGVFALWHNWEGNIECGTVLKMNEEVILGDDHANRIRAVVGEGEDDLQRCAHGLLEVPLTEIQISLSHCSG